MAQVSSISRPAGRPPRHLEPELVRELRSLGLSFRQIASRTGFGYGTVRRAFQKTLGTVEPDDDAAGAQYLEKRQSA